MDSLNTNKVKYIYTAALYYCFIACGLCFSIFNPTLIDLKDIFNTSLEKASLVFPIRSAGYVIGSLSCGVVTTLFNRQLVLIIILLLKSITIVSVPHWHNVNQFYANGVFNGFFTAGIDTTVNVWVNEMWGTDGGPYMQALHFFFGIGSILGPILSEPFLSVNKNQTQTRSLDKYLIELNTESLINPFDYSLVKNNTADSKLWIPYTISSLTAIISAIIFMVLFVSIRYQTPNHSRSASEESEESEQLVTENTSRRTGFKFQCFDCSTIWMISISCLFLVVFAGQETAYFQFSASFATETDLHLSKNTAAFMASALALSFTITRALSIPLSIKISPQYMIYADCLVIFTAQIIILVYANTNQNYLWLGNVLMGAGFASIFPSFYPFVEKQLKITNIIGSIFIFCTGLSSCVCPLIVGLFIESKPFMLIYLCLTSTLLTVLALILMHSSVKIIQIFENRRQIQISVTIAEERQHIG